MKNRNSLIIFLFFSLFLSCTSSKNKEVSDIKDTQSADHKKPVLENTINNNKTEKIRKNEKEKYIYEYSMEEIEKQEAGNRLIKTGMDLLKKGSDVEALTKIKEGLSLFEEIKFRHGIIDTYSDLALFYEAKNLPEKSINYFRESIPFRSDIRDLTGLFYVYFNIAILFEKLNDFENALLYYQKALNMKEMNKNAEFAEIYNNVGVIYSKKGLHNEAINYYEKSFALSDKNRITKNFLLLVCNILSTYISLDRVPDSFSYLDILENNLNLVEENSQKPGIYYILARIYEFKSNLTKAIEYMKKAVEIEEKLNSTTQNQNKKYLKYLKKKKEYSEDSQ